MTAHDELYQRWKLLNAQQVALADAHMAVMQAAAVIELQLFEAEGRGHLARAEWLRRWLAGDYEGAATVCASEQYRREICEAGPTHLPPVAEAA